jgi:hypothetical protein
MYFDRKHDAALQQVAEAVAAGETAAPMGGGDMGGMDLGGGEEAPAEIPAGDVGEDPAAGGGEESALLAVPPGSRNAPRLTTGAPRLTTGAKGKVYFPTKRDGRKSAGFHKNQLAQSNVEKRGSAHRAKFPGSEISSIPSIAKGIYEEEASIYSLKESVEEQKLFEVDASLHGLILDLEKNSKLITEQNNED